MRKVVTIYSMNLRTAVIVTAYLFVAVATRGRESQFNEYLTKHGIVYTDSEYEARLDIFSRNWETIDKHNSMSATSDSLAQLKLGDTPFLHLTNAEFASFVRGGAKHTRQPVTADGVPVHTASANERLPDEVDWAVAGAVTPVKNQGMW